MLSNHSSIHCTCVSYIVYNMHIVYNKAYDTIIIQENHAVCSDKDHRLSNTTIAAHNDSHTF